MSSWVEDVYELNKEEYWSDEYKNWFKMMLYAYEREAFPMGKHVGGYMLWKAEMPVFKEGQVRRSES